MTRGEPSGIMPQYAPSLEAWGTMTARVVLNVLSVPNLSIVGDSLLKVCLPPP